MISSVTELLCSSCLVIAALTIVGPALAVERPGPVGVAPSDVRPSASTAEITERIRREAEERELRVVGLGRVRLSHPQKLSAGIGAMVASQPVSFDCTSVCQYRGFLLEAEPGIAGGQLGAGYAVVVGDTSSNERFLSNIYLAYGIRGALLRTWGDSSLHPSDQTLLGVEGDFTVIRVNFSLGVFRHVGSGDPEDDWLISGGIGWGF